MGFFGGLFKAAINTVTLPISAAKDVVTGDWLDDRNATTRNIDRMKKNANEIERSLEDDSDV